MRIQFVNKNNNVWYDIEPGLTITDNYNETLDSAQLVLSHIVNKLNIEPFDRVIIDMNGVYKYMCVDTYSCTQISFSSPIYYEYSIYLFSETKLLEGIVLPSLKITQLKGPNRRKIRYYLDEYLNEYGRKVRKKINNNISYQPLWHFSETVKTRFNEIECPEMQWNQPTLRQVLNDLMMIDDCIVVLRNNEIDCIDVSKLGSEISAIGISQVQESRSSQDYVSELRVELKNVMQSNINGVNDVITATELIGFRNSNSFKLNDTNFRIEVSNPIIELIEVKLFAVDAPAGGRVENAKYWQADITDFIFEYKEWITKPTWWSIRGTTPDLNKPGEYQENSLYYQRGGKTIENLNTSIYHDGYEAKLFSTILDCLFYKYHEPSASAIDHNAYSFAPESLRSFAFQIKYKTTASSLMQVSRSDSVNNHRVVVDNQTNSYVDAYAQGLLEYMKVNRLGNTMKTIDARYSYNDTIPELSQTYNGSVIFQRKLSYFDDYIEANFTCTEGYVLRDYFTGVQAKIRSWKIVDGNEALERHDLIKYYLEFSYNNVSECDSNESNMSLSNYFLNQFNDNSIKLLQYGCCIFTLSIVTDPELQIDTLPSITDEKHYLVDTVSRISGNSLLLTFGFEDNYSVGKYIDTSINVSDLGANGQQPLRYVDAKGENIGGTIIFTDKIKNGEVIEEGMLNLWYGLPDLVDGVYNAYDYNEHGDWTVIVYPSPVQGAIANYETIETFLRSISTRRPFIENNELIGDINITIPFNFKKDNSEITRITTQFEFCSDTRDIVFGSQFLKNLQAIRTVELNINGYKLYESDKQPSFRNKDFLPNDKAPVGSMQLFLSNNQLTVTYSSASKKDYLYLTDENDNVIIAFKKVGETVTTMYLNLLKDRNKNIYDDNGYIVGNIYI